MEKIESAKCDCCGLKEDCTQDYIAQIKLNFEGKWLCGLCAEAVRDEIGKASKGPTTVSSAGVGEALKAHISFCRKFKSNPAGGLADGMRQMLRRRSVDLAGDGGGGAHGMRQKFRRRSVEFAGYGGSTSGGGGGGGDGGGTVRGGPKKYSQVGDGSSISMF